MALEDSNERTFSFFSIIIPKSIYLSKFKSMYRCMIHTEPMHLKKKLIVNDLCQIKPQKDLYVPMTLESNKICRVFPVFKEMCTLWYRYAIIKLNNFLKEQRRENYISNEVVLFLREHSNTKTTR